MEYAMNFQTPYSRWDKARRLLWTIVWNVGARPLPNGIGRRWINLLLRLFGAKIASTADVHSSTKIFKPWLLEMGEYACLAGGVDCYNAAPIRLGAYAVVSQRAYLCTAGHDIADRNNRQTEAPITIGPRAWVCAEAYVGMGVTVGEGAVVAARAVAVHDIAPWNVVGGNPAKYIKMRMLKEFNRGG